jgi:prevent-host-death family protein
MAERRIGNRWKLQDAKARLSELVDLALKGRPQRISRRGKEAVVVVRVTDFDARNKAGDIVEFFSRSPHREIELAAPRRRDTGRDLDL